MKSIEYFIDQLSNCFLHTSFNDELTIGQRLLENKIDGLLNLPKACTAFFYNKRHACVMDTLNKSPEAAT